MEGEQERNISELMKSLSAVNALMRKLNVPENVLEKEIKPFGNASHIILPKEYTKKKAKIIIRR